MGLSGCAPCGGGGEFGLNLVVLARWLAQWLARWLAHCYITHMTATARRRQPAITIRSEKAVARLRLLTRDGKSQAEVIEEALEKMPLPKSEKTLAEKLAEIKAITSKIRHLPRATMAELDALEYDEFGNCR